MLAVGVGLSHAGTVRLADRLTAEGLIESRSTSTDGRVRSLHLTSAGQEASAAVLSARDRVIGEGLSILNKGEMKFWPTLPSASFVPAWRTSSTPIASAACAATKVAPIVLSTRSFMSGGRTAYDGRTGDLEVRAQCCAIK